MSYRERMRAIELSDQARRDRRERDELVSLYGTAKERETSIPRNAMVIRADAKAMGAVTAHKPTASADTWNSGVFKSGRVWGVSPSAMSPSHPLYGVHSVRVTRNGVTETVTVASLRRSKSEPRDVARDTVATSDRLNRLQALAGNNSDAD